MVQIRVLLNVWMALSFTFSASLTYRIERQCDWNLFYCDHPYDVEETLQFMCTYDNDCPTNFMCCSHRCFTHKICQPFKNTQDFAMPSPESYEVTHGECDVTITCDIPLPIAFTKSFECFDDNNCPDHYKCCFVDCYNHKVCQRGKNEHQIFHFTSSIAQEAISSNFPTESTALRTSSISKTTINDISLETTIETMSEETEVVTEITTTQLTSSSSAESSTLTVQIQIIETSVNVSSPQTTKIPTVTKTTSQITEHSTEIQSTSKTTDNRVNEEGLSDTTLHTPINATHKAINNATNGFKENGDDEDNTTISSSTLKVIDDFESSGDFEIIGDDEDYTTKSTLINSVVKSTADTETNEDFQIIERVQASSTSTSTHDIAKTTNETGDDLGTSDFHTSENFGLIRADNEITDFTLTSDVIKTTSQTSAASSATEDFQIIGVDEDDATTFTTSHDIVTTIKTADDLGVSGHLEITGDDEDNTTISLLTNDTVKITSKTPLDFEASGNFEIFDDDDDDDDDADDDTSIPISSHNMTTMTSKISTDIEAHRETGTIEDSENDTAISTSLDNTTTTITNLTKPIETSTEADELKASDDLKLGEDKNNEDDEENKITTALYITTEKIPDTTIKTSLTTESTTVHTEAIDLAISSETQRAETEEDDTVVYEEEIIITASTSIIFEHETSSKSISRNISTADSTETNSETNNFRTSGRDEEVPESTLSADKKPVEVVGNQDFIFSGDGDNDDEDYPESNNVSDQKSTDLISYPIKETGDNTIIENNRNIGESNKYIKSIDSINTANRNTINLNDNDNDEMYNIYNYYDLNDKIDE